MDNEPSKEELARAVQLLEDSGNYRILRRLDPRNLITPTDDYDPKSIRRALVVDTETTGLDKERDEVIEVGMVSFDYKLNGEIVRLVNCVSQLNEPSAPLSDEVKRVTGLTDEMLKGQKLDIHEIEEMAKDCSIVFAHHAAFDRAFMERLSTIFEAKPWACSMSDIEWTKEGITSLGLENIAHKFNYFFESHRAMSDCMATVALLATKLPSFDGETALSRLLNNARKEVYYVAAMEAPFDLKGLLSERGYKWFPGDSMCNKHWYTKVSPDELDDEIEWLQTNINKNHKFHIQYNQATPYERYTSRERKELVRWVDERQSQMSFSGPR